MKNYINCVDYFKKEVESRNKLTVSLEYKKKQYLNLLLEEVNTNLKKINEYNEKIKSVFRKKTKTNGMNLIKVILK